MKWFQDMIEQLKEADIKPEYLIMNKRDYFKYKTKQKNKMTLRRLYDRAK